MVAELLLGLSVLSQFIAAGIAVALVIKTGWWKGLGVLALALFLMGVRRSIAFYRLLTEDAFSKVDLTAEWVALTISVLLLIGLALLAPVLRRSIRTLRTLEQRETRLADAQAVAKIGEWSRYVGDLNIQWSDEVYRIFERSPDNFKPTYDSLTALIHKNDLPAMDAAHEKAVLRHEPIFTDYRVKLPDNTWKWVQVGLSANYAADGTPSEFFGMIQDIDERKTAEQRSVENGRLLNSLLEYSPALIAIRGVDGRYLLVNKAYAELLGGVPQDFVGKKPLDFIEREVADTFVLYDAQVMASKNPILHEHEVLSNGKLRSFLTVRFPIIDENGDVVSIGAFATDIGNYKKTERALARAENEYRAVVEDQTELISRYKPDGKRTFVNEAYCRFHNKSREQLLSESAYAGMNDDDLARLKSLCERLTPGQPTGLFDINFIDQDGNQCWQQWTKRANFDENGHVVEYQGVGRDVTEQHQAEEDRRLALIEAERANQSKSEFLATMSHELRTPLNAIIGFSEVINGQFFGPLNNDKYADYAENIFDSGHHLLELVNDILDIERIEAGRHELDFETLDLDAITRSCTRLSGASQLIGRIKFECLIAPDLSPLVADERAVKQIIVNLLSNAFKFTPDGGRVNLSISSVQNEHIIEVTDTGQGIPKNAIDDITIPFRRVNNNPLVTQEGAGLGLSIVEHLVKLHNGRLIINSEVKKGTTMLVHLPSQPNKRRSIQNTELKNDP